MGNVLIRKRKKTLCKNHSHRAYHKFWMKQICFKIDKCKSRNGALVSEALALFNCYSGSPYVAYVVPVTMRVIFCKIHKVHELYLHNRKTPVAIFSNGCVAVTIKFIRYLCAFLLKYYFKVDYFYFRFIGSFSTEAYSTIRKYRLVCFSIIHFL